MIEKVIVWLTSFGVLSRLLVGFELRTSLLRSEHLVHYPEGSSEPFSRFFYQDALRDIYTSRSIFG